MQSFEFGQSLHRVGEVKEHKDKHRDIEVRRPWRQVETIHDSKRGICYCACNL